MKNLEFPIIGTKVKGVNKKFDLNSPEGRKSYFEAKVGDEIKHIKAYLKNNTFLIYLLGKKNSGKGTYSKLMAEIFGSNKISHVSVGDLIRTADNWESFSETDTYERLKRYYRGYISFEDAVNAHLGRSTERLLPTEFILSLLKAHIDTLPGKSIFIDGLPRNMDQISYSLYFRDLIGYRDDPDMFALIDIPEAVIEERMKYRAVCPSCQTSRNRKLLITSKVGYDPKTKEFYLICDNPDCRDKGKARMVSKEGDDKGLDPIRDRLNKDEELLRQTFNLHGVPKILLRNHVPVNEAGTFFDSYEITPEYTFNWDTKKRQVDVIEKPYSVKDDNGILSNSLLAPPVIVSMIKQLVEILSL